MTIKVEREALLRVLSHEPSGSSSSCDHTQLVDDGEFVLVEIPKPFIGDEGFVRGLLRSTSDDDLSLCTLSTDSLSTDATESIRRVTFATPLVTEEWSRPWTPREEVSSLFYSTEETQRFRQEYRLERKVLNELAIDPDAFSDENEELSCLIATSSCQSNSRHRISRVVVVHNDRLETFFNPDEVIEFPEDPDCSDVFFDSDSFWSGSLTWY